MSNLDHGGFDMMFEVAEEAAGGLMRSRVAIPDTSEPFNSNGVQGTATIHVAPESVRFPNGTAINMDFSLAGSTLDISAWPAPIALPTVDHIVHLDATVTIFDLIDTSGLSAVVNTTPGGAHGTPNVSVTLDRDAVLASTPVMVLLAAIYLQGGEAQMVTMRELMLQDLQDQLQASVVNMLATQPIVETLLSIPGTFVPPSPAPLLSTPATQNPVNIDTVVGSLRVGASLGGARGNAGLITRSALRRSSTTGQAIDSVALILSNACLLRDFVRPAVANSLGLFAQPGGFLAGDPFMWFGSAPATIGGVASTVSSASAFVNESGQLVVAFTFDQSSLAGGITAHATVTTTIDVSATTSASGVTLTLTPRPSAISNAHVDIAWWVYALSAAALGVVGVAAMAVADAILDGTLAGTVVTVPASSFSVPLPPGLPPVFLTGLSLFQSDAPRRTVTIPAGPFTFTMPAAGRDHDLIVTVALS